MPWEARAIVGLRKDFVLKALAKESAFAELCRRYGISRKTGYRSASLSTWLRTNRCESSLNGVWPLPGEPQ